MGFVWKNILEIFLVSFRLFKTVSMIDRLKNWLRHLFTCSFTWQTSQKCASSLSLQRHRGGLLAGNSHILVALLWICLWEVTIQKGILRISFFSIVSSVFFHISIASVCFQNLWNAMYQSLSSMDSTKNFSLLWIRSKGPAVLIQYFLQSNYTVRGDLPVNSSPDLHKGRCPSCQADLVLNTYFDRIKLKSGMEIDTWTLDSVLCCSCCCQKVARGADEHHCARHVLGNTPECRSMSVCQSVIRGKVCGLKVLLVIMFANYPFPKLFIYLLFGLTCNFIIDQKYLNIRIALAWPHFFF